MLHQFMVEKLKIAENWLPRYTGTQIDEFGESILLTNFKDYVTAFAEKFDVEVKGEGKPMQSLSLIHISEPTRRM